MTMRRRRGGDNATRVAGAGPVHYRCMTLTRECAGDGCTTGARQGACQGARRQGARQGARHGVGGTARPQTCTRHDTTFQSGTNEREENTCAEGHGRVRRWSPGATPCMQVHPHPCKVTRRRRHGVGTTTTWRRRGEDSGAVRRPVRMPHCHCSSGQAQPSHAVTLAATRSLGLQMSSYPRCRQLQLSHCTLTPARCRDDTVAATSARAAGASQLHHRCIKQGGASARDQVQDR